MPDREKVLKGLEEIASSDWMRKKADYWAMVCRDALELLKTPKARVLAVKEVRDYIGEVLWMEVEPDDDGHMISMTPVALDDIRTDMNDDYEEDEYLVFSDGFDPVSQYGHWYRLWTARPTEAQRKEVKWDE